MCYYSATIITQGSYMNLKLGQLQRERDRENTKLEETEMIK